MDLQAVYHRSPYPVRVAAASAQGLLLRSRRYGRDTDRLVAEALEREHWSDEHWTTWREDALSTQLRGALAHAPAYRGLRLGDGPATDALAGLPLLAKGSLRADPRSFVRDDAPRGLVAEHTSGSTGTPLTLWIARPDYRAWYALSEARWRRWYGVSRHDRWAIVGGQPVVPPGATGPPYWVWNAGLRQLYLSSDHVGERTAAAYVEALDRHRVTHVLGYPSALHALAEACRRRGLAPRSPAVVVANAEPLLPHQRAVIAEVFGCPVRETYGMAEYVAAASECDHGRLHLWPEVGVLEVLGHDADEPVAAGETGRLVCTGLLNRSMPLVRYVVGDAGAVAPPGDPCPCGRTLPVLSSVEGRLGDLVRTPDGRLIGRFGRVFTPDLPIAGAQLVQEELARFRVLVVPAEGFGPRASEALVAALRRRVGDVQVDVEVVDRLPTGPNGKLRAVVSHVTSDG